ncbi:hypothetical protein BKA24_001701 [Microbacterium marinum]|uniref:Helix-turn-helix domain-containing protein n=1 Tax=Microbacterium marinum TaxID=421115 RepID=A0A7W7BQK8_9MICO|nr:helix-turn-helix domain-containing protein [Microbacterium marinum]MBB4666992.1 hypothetical protein [Microbacterium marinum]
MLDRLFTTTEVAAIARRHVVTVRLALEAGDLHGTQRVPRGRWLVAEPCLAAYLEGRRCDHRQ